MYMYIYFPEYSGMLPAECDKQFLDIASRLDRYGMDFHQIIVSTLCMYMYFFLYYHSVLNHRIVLGYSFNWVCPLGA